MHIGITYDLKEDYLKKGFTEEESAEFDRPETIEAIEKSLRDLGHTTERIGGLEGLISRLNSKIKWDLVFNIAEGLYGIGREALIPALLDSYRIPCTFSDACVLAVSLNKTLTKRIIRDAGILTPAFLEVRDIRDLDRFDLEFPVFAKPSAEGTGKGIYAHSKIIEMNTLKETCGSLLDKFKKPVLVEEYLPGREFTTAITGTGITGRVLGTMEVIFRENAAGEFYSFHNKSNYLDVVEYRLAEDSVAGECEKLALKSWDVLGCRDAGRIDIRYDRNGRANFIEINPIAGLHPVDSDVPIICSLVGLPYHELIREIITSASMRLV
jgi:D-alanine-D-alanine ligase